MSASHHHLLHDVEVVRKNNVYSFFGKLEFSVCVDDELAPDQLQKEIDNIGQQIKRQAYQQILQRVENQLTGQFQLADPCWQRRGTRPYTFVTTFGRVPIQRSRLCHRTNKQWCVPADRVWKTPHRTYVVKALRASSCRQVQNLSTRKTARALSEQAGEPKLLSHTTVCKFYHEEGRRLDQTQRHEAQRILHADPKILASGLTGLVSPAKSTTANDRAANDHAAATQQSTSSPTALWLPDSFGEDKEKVVLWPAGEQPAACGAAKPTSTPEIPARQAGHASVPVARQDEPAVDDSPCVCQGGRPLIRSFDTEHEEDLPELTAEELKEVRQRAIGFLQQDEVPPGDPRPSVAKESSQAAASPAISPARMSTEEQTPGGPAPGNSSSDGAGRVAACRLPCQVEEGWVMLQVDEVLTKAQACQQAAQKAQGHKTYKYNRTYTATISAQGRVRYLAACCLTSLWAVVAAALSSQGVLDGSQGLLVLGDGAYWIREWFSGLKLRTLSMVLCWYHLTKMVYARLSQCGLSKARRQEVERTVLGHLWRGEISQAVWHLWGVRAELSSAKGKLWLTRLIQYLLERREYLPNYRQRHQLGLWIASTQVEKWNDLAVADRCKRRGMSWTGEGVLSLALHQSAVRNAPPPCGEQLSQAAA